MNSPHTSWVPSRHPHSGLSYSWQFGPKGSQTPQDAVDRCIFGWHQTVCNCHWGTFCTGRSRARLAVRRHCPSYIPERGHRKNRHRSDRSRQRSGSTPQNRCGSNISWRFRRSDLQKSHYCMKRYPLQAQLSSLYLRHTRSLWCH